MVSLSVSRTARVGLKYRNKISDRVSASSPAARMAVRVCLKYQDKTNAVVSNSSPINKIAPGLLSLLIKYSALEARGELDGALYDRELFR